MNTMMQILMVCVQAALIGSSAFATEMQTKDVKHVTVRHEPGRYFGWPANGGIWNWGDEILVQYRHGEFLDKPPGSHDINTSKPIVIDQSRSLDGGLTWTHHATKIVNSEDGPSPTNAPALATPIDFSSPDTILKFEWAGCLYYSTDRGVNWRGPPQPAEVRPGLVAVADRLPRRAQEHRPGVLVRV